MYNIALDLLNRGRGTGLLVLHRRHFLEKN
jgi:hypothetical protein